MKGLAIISVYDKTGLEPFARGLTELGYQILSTGGTAKFLEQNRIPLTPISEYTGHPEILEGRVKSLHPKIHGGILARKDRADDLADLERQGIHAIDLVIVNLYPFIQQIFETEKKGVSPHDSLVEFIDIGGPTMIRAAAKNSAFVVPVCDPSDYEVVLRSLKEEGSVPQDLRQELAAKVFAMTAAYDGAIARYFSLGEQVLDAAGVPKKLAPIESQTLVRSMELRYGENPHQVAGLYRPYSFPGLETQSWWEQIQGKELSYNNLLDMHATLDLFLELLEGVSEGHVSVIIKHSNPCGAASGATPLEAFTKARDCDPLSAFGGIVAVSGSLSAELAETILSGFVEVLLCTDVSEEALEVLAKKKNLRLIVCDAEKYLEARSRGSISFRNSHADYLLQTTDAALSIPSLEQVASGVPPTEQVLQDMIFAWRVCKHVKSNAIVLVKDGCAIGVGAGQMSRVDAAKLAVQRAGVHGFSVSGSVAASDAFLPFSDTLEYLNDAGVQALVQPGGSIKDEDVIECARKRGVSMIFTGERHFRH